ncbi:MAG TPA: MBL fold metallo-hydrolase [Anaerolineae bacterium]
MTAAAEIVPGLYQLPGVSGAGCFLWRPAGGEGRGSTPILFDCGLPWSGRGLTASLVALGCDPEELEIIAITHDDIDHTGRLAPLQAVSGATVVAHDLEAPRITGEQWRRPPLLGGPLGPIARLLDRFYQTWPHRPVRVGLQVTDGALLPDGWIAVHTPGHTPGHASYFHQRRGLLVAGDAVGRRGGRLRFPMAVYTEDRAAATRSIRKLAELAPQVVVFGHGPALHDAAAPLREFAARLPQ